MKNDQDPLQPKNQPMAIDINPETTPVLYTDNMIMSTNENGLIIDVAQSLGLTNRLRIVARIGMSREHAKKFLNELGKLLAMTEGQLQTGEQKKH